MGRIGDDDTVRLPGVRGHARAGARLSRAIRRDQLHHGLLLLGPVGVGRATFARGLGCALHCRVDPGVGCGTCNDCHRVLNGTHAGIEFIVPEGPGGTIKVDAARTLANRLQHAPFEGDAHLVVFDPGDALGEAALNALLKAIEEPPPGVHFVFIVTHTETLLPTIVSRCLPVRLGPLSAQDLAAVLDEALARGDGESGPVEIDDDRRALALRLAQGSARRAVELAMDATLDAALGLVRNAMQAADVGPAAIFAGDKSPLWTSWTEVSGGPGPERPARERATCARLIDLWLLDVSGRMHGDGGLPGLPGRDADDARRVYEIDRLLTLRETLDRNPQVRVALEHTLLELSSPPQ